MLRVPSGLPFACGGGGGGGLVGGLLDGGGGGCCGICVCAACTCGKVFEIT